MIDNDDNSLTDIAIVASVVCANAGDVNCPSKHNVGLK